MPMINWEPLNPSKQGDCARWALDNIILGHHDTYIRKWAQAAKSYGGKILLRFAHEIERLLVHLGRPGRCDNTHEPVRFRVASASGTSLRGVGGVGATNVKFVWSPYRKDFSAFFPGDNYVDYLGTTAFSWSPSRGKAWRSRYQPR